jgi:tRNA-modifying protein YgfZ
MSLNLENKFILLNTSSMIKVEGDDRVPFLQGQLTQDIKLISHDKALFAGFCNPKGRVLAFMLCFEEYDSIYIQIDSSIAEPILRRLQNVRSALKSFFEFTRQPIYVRRFCRI